MQIPFNRPYLVGNELPYISQAYKNGQLAGDGQFTKKCHFWLEQKTQSLKSLLTHSCTAALEMTGILANLQAGDEVIMPSYTFVSTANAFVMRGAVPVFVDIRPDTLNIDEKLIEQAITKKTKAIIPVHYAGVGCEMDAIIDIAKKYNLLVIEDAAQGILATYKTKPLGSIGDFGCLSFHETKNITSGEGGALLVNNSQFINRAEIIREKGTNRGQLFLGHVDKYTWVDKGSSFLPGELSAAFLFAQMEAAASITKMRLDIWYRYHEAFIYPESIGRLTRPFVPQDCQHNAHMYYVLLESAEKRSEVIAKLKNVGINAVFHYVPLHGSIAGKSYGRVSGEIKETDDKSSRLLRLPLWVGLSHDQQDFVIQELCKATL